MCCNSAGQASHLASIFESDLPSPPSPPHENMTQELKLLAEDAAVYKMIGPALVRQEPGEAVANVGKRLEFIGGACQLFVWLAGACCCVQAG